MILLTFFGFLFINKLMAIRRCPYCKAIIDEAQKYCNNCGTQLLFPEDEFVEEDIPGEKIVDTEFEEKEQGESSLEFQDEGIEKEEIDLEEVLEGGGALPGEEEQVRTGDAQPVTYEVDEAPEKPTDQIVKELEEEARRTEETESAAGEELPPATIEVEEVPGQSGAEPSELSGEPSIEGAEIDVSPEKPSADRASLEEQEEIARIIAALERKQKEEETFKALETSVKLPAEKEAEPPALEGKDGLPSWLESAKATSPSELFADKKEPEEETSFAPGDTYEFKEEVLSEAEKYASPQTGMGIPETVTRGLPSFEETEAVHDSGELMRPAEDEILAGRTDEEEEAAQPALRLATKARAVFFDLAFIFIIWAVSLGLASRIMSASISKLVSISAGSFILFYIVLAVAYFFLFLFFLGETLGDRVVFAKD